MSPTVAISALFLYPLLFSLPFNPASFRWALRQGLTPMPPEVLERAEVVDRVVLFGNYVVLMAVVGLLLHGSLVTVHAVGITSDNWKSAIVLGVLLSFVSWSLVVILQRLVPPDQLREASESRGPLAVWCGLAVLSSLSIEFWRAFSIAALIRLDVSPLVVILAVAVAYGIPRLATSVGWAAGAATFGGVAGFLFVKTGSLLAPLTMSLFAAGAQLYRVRHISSAPRCLAGREYLTGSQTQDRAQNPRRYVSCPVCGAIFHRGKVKKTLRAFICPDCGAALEYETRGFDYFLLFFCLYGVPASLYFFGYRGLTLVFVSIGAATLIFFFGVAAHSLIVPPRAQQKLSYGDSGLRLTDKNSRSKNNHRSKGG